jgi:hypothetical protein
MARPQDKAQFNKMLQDKDERLHASAQLGLEKIAKLEAAQPTKTTASLGQKQTLKTVVK